MLVPVREFTSAAEMRASYAQGRRNFLAGPHKVTVPVPSLEPAPPPSTPQLRRPTAAHDQGPRYFPTSKATPPADIIGGPSISSVLTAVGVFYGVNSEIIISRSKGKREDFARQVSMYLIRVVTGWPFLKIAARIDRDHATVMFACKKMSKLACEDIGFAHDLFDIMVAIRAIYRPLAHGGVAYGGHRAPAVVGPSAGAPGGAS